MEHRTRFGLRIKAHVDAHESLEQGVGGRDRLPGWALDAVTEEGSATEGSGLVDGTPLT